MKSVPYHIIGIDGRRCAGQQYWLGNVAFGSRTTDSRYPRNVRLSPDSDQIAAPRYVTLRATNGLMHCTNIEKKNSIRTAGIHVPGGGF